MITIRRAPTNDQNPDVVEKPAREAETNVEWLRRIGARGGILLIGGASLSHFRMRVAQSHLRQDLFPSLWSVAAILDASGRRVTTVSFGWGRHVSVIPRINAIQTRPVSDYADPGRYPNVAWLRFPTDGSVMERAVERLRGDRSIVDLPKLVLAWLGFAWGAGHCGNPLLDGMGIPSASFVEAAYAIAGVELTPGLSSSASCPEAIWQSAKWWREYYVESEDDGERSSKRVPTGFFVVRQRAAAIVVENGTVERPLPDGPRRVSKRAASRRRAQSQSRA